MLVASTSSVRSGNTSAYWPRATASTAWRITARSSSWISCSASWASAPVTHIHSTGPPRWQQLQSAEGRRLDLLAHGVVPGGRAPGDHHPQAVVDLQDARLEPFVCSDGPAPFPAVW